LWLLMEAYERERTEEVMVKEEMVDYDAAMDAPRGDVRRRSLRRGRPRLTRLNWQCGFIGWEQPLRKEQSHFHCVRKEAGSFRSTVPTDTAPRTEYLRHFPHEHPQLTTETYRILHMQ
jgi:hypothetical protein